MTDKASIEVAIFGSKYVLKGDSEPAYMQELAQLVDTKMRELKMPANTALHRVAILAALMLADELSKARRSLDGERQRYDHAARSAALFDLKLQELLQEAVTPSAGPDLHVEEHAEEMEIEPPISRSKDDLFGR